MQPVMIHGFREDNFPIQNLRQKRDEPGMHPYLTESVQDDIVEKLKKPLIFYDC